MRASFVVMAGLMLSFLSGCGYEHFVKRDVKVPYVFVPPSKDFTPYSIVAYNEDENFQTVCPAAILIGQMSMDEFVRTYLDDSKGSPVGSIGVRESGSYTMKVDLTVAEVASIGAQYAGTYKATMNLKNGKVFTVNDARFSIGSLFLAMRENESCLLNLASFMGSSKKYRYILVNSVFRYDTSFALESTTGASATLAPAVQQLLLEKVSAELGRSTVKSIDAPSLYIGFRGLDQVPPDDTGKRGEALRQARLVAQKAAEEANAANAKALAAEADKRAAEAKAIAHAKTAADARAHAAAQTQAAVEAKVAGIFRDETEKAAVSAKVNEVAIANSTIAPSLAMGADGNVLQGPRVPTTNSQLPNPASTAGGESDFKNVAVPVRALDVTAVVIETLATNGTSAGATSIPPAMSAPASAKDVMAPTVAR